VSFTYLDDEQKGIDFTMSTGLKTGDLILYPGRPALRLGESHKDLAFIGSFLALRPKSDEAGVWLWGLLNTTVGRKFLDLAARTTGSIAPRYTVDFLQFEVPQLPENIKEISDKLKILERDHIRHPISHQPVKEKSSWSKFVNLDEIEVWKTLFTSPDDLRVFSGIKLKDMVQAVHVGKDEMPVEGGDGTIKLATHKTVMTGEYGRTKPGAKTYVASPGTLLVPVVGERNGAFLLAEEAAIGKGVYALELLPKFSVEHVRDFFLSEVGRIQRRNLVRGVALKSLSRTALENFQIPDSFVEQKHSGLKATDFDWILQ
jgi:hypothetical protein